MKVSVDQDKCISSGQCVSHASEVFDQRDEDGVVVLLNENPPAAQAMADPAYHKIVVKDALGSSSLVQVIEGINRCLPDLPAGVHAERNIMARNLLMHTCAEWERALADGVGAPRSGWGQATSGLIDAIVGLWLAPVTAPDGKGDGRGVR